MKRLFAILLAAAVGFTAMPAQDVFAAEKISTNEEVALTEEALEVETDAEAVEQVTEDETALVNRSADDKSIDESYEMSMADYDDGDDDEDSSITIDKETLFVGDFTEASFMPDDLDEEVDTDKTVWSSDKPNIAKIIKTEGNRCFIKGIKKGKATITAEIEGWGSRTAEISVVDIPQNWIECEQSQKSKYKNTIRILWGDELSGLTMGSSGVTGYAIYVNSKKVVELDEEDVQSFYIQDGDMSYGPYCYYDLKVKNGKKYDIYLKNYSDVTDPTTNKTTRIYGKKTDTERILYLADFKVNSIKNSSKKALTIKWSTKSKVTGYQIEYATNKIFDEAKTVDIKSANTKSKKITGLKKGKTYYVRIRPYKTFGKKKYYGGWLENLTGVKIKK